MTVSDDDLARLRAKITSAIDEWRASLVTVSDKPALDGVDTSKFTLTFDEPFDTLDWSRWSSVYRWNQRDGADAPDIAGCSLPPNGELGWYVNRNYPLTSDIRPWRVEGGELILIADRMPPALKPLLGYNQADLKNLGAYDYLTGLVHTGSSFRQRYGYFEATMRWDAGKGLWPAFWLLPLTGKPPEIDVVEVLGDRPDRLWHTVHSANGAPQHFESYIPKDGGFHRIGVLWTAEIIAWYVDGREIGRLPTRADAHVEMYCLINLAVGGNWPGSPDYFTKFPATLRVSSVKVWQVF